ncbi:hypothetical protein [Pseudoalteromonas luteoviolacea]|uniref:hypothetical protein n=1 Tax=Pseudoalteromonas luteoviolacea TaxID=43657 RepID=UPI0012DA5D08|nr:hypothetical protein [Pseudoalteromonas luteoviolacea]
MSKSLRIRLTVVFSAVIGLVAFPISLIFRYDFFIFPSLLLGFFLPFFLLLEWKIERVLKGLCVILYGILGGILIPQIVEQYIPESFSQNFEIYKNLVVFACSGAGGSIIASHAEQLYQADEKQEVKETVVDKTQKIEQLITSVEELRKTTIRIHITYGVLILIGAVAFAI